MIKLIEKNILSGEELINQTCIAVRLIKSIQINILIEEWELYWVENKYDQEHIKTYKLEKNINSSNIIEKLIEFSIV